MGVDIVQAGLPAATAAVGVLLSAPTGCSAPGGRSATATADTGGRLMGLIGVMMQSGFSIGSASRSSLRFETAGMPRTTAPLAMGDSCLPGLARGDCGMLTIGEEALG